MHTRRQSRWFPCTKGGHQTVMALAGALLIAFPSAALARSERAEPRAGAPPTQRPLEHTLGATRSAALMENAAMHSAIANAGSVNTTALGSPGRRPLQARIEPVVGPASPSPGPAFLAQIDAHPIARGGGPRTTQSLVAADLPSARGIEPAGTRVVSAPLGCSRIDAAGAPGVTRISLSVASRSGRVLAHSERNGRIAALRFCPPTDGTYTIRASSVGGTVPDPVQIFVE